MKSRNYIKLSNNQNTTEEIFNKLSLAQKKKLNKLISSLDERLESFKENQDIAYSMLMHVLTGKIILEEKEVTKKELVATQTKPFNKFEKVDSLISGEIKW